MKDLAFEVSRLADALESILEMQTRRAHEQRDERLKSEWGDPVRPVNLGTFLGAIPGLAAKFDRVVPPEFAAQTGADELTIACPCGEAPQIRAGRLVSCSCGRWFLHDGRRVHVALSPHSPAIEPEIEPDHPLHAVAATPSA